MPASSKKLWPVALLLAGVGIGAGGYTWYLRQAPTPPPVAEPQPAPDPKPVTPVIAPIVNEDAGAAPINETPDEKLRRLASPISNADTFAKWIGSQGILQRVAAATKMVADGQSPAKPLGFIRVKGRFAYREVGSGADERTFMSAASYRRYDGIGKVMASIDGEACGRAYRALRPSFNKLYEQIAAPGQTFDDVLVKATDRLLEVQVPTGEIELVPKGAIFHYKDPKLEKLAPAQKHLVRMGPRNAKLVQDVLQKCRVAAGLPR